MTRVDRDRFDRHDATEADCFAAGYDAAVEQAFSAAAAACLATCGTWAEGAHAALGALLEYVAASLFVGAPPDLRLAAFERRQKAVDLVSAEFLDPRFAEAGDHLPDRRLLVEMIAGGIFQLFAQHAAAGTIVKLPDALPAVTMLALAPFIDHDEVQRLAAMPSPGDA